MGPILLETIPESCSPIKDMLVGEYPLCPQLCWNVVDVRDVAISHIRALEIPSAKGRYLITNNNMWFLEMCNTLRNFYPEYPIPKYPLPNMFGYLIGLYDPRITVAYLWVNLGQVRLFNNKKSTTELSMTYRPLEQTVLDCGRSMIEKHLIKKPSTSLISPSIIFLTCCAALLYYACKRNNFNVMHIVRSYIPFYKP